MKPNTIDPDVIATADTVVSPVSEFSDFVQLMRWRSQHHPERIAYTFLTHGEGSGVSCTYRELDEAVQIIAAHLQAVVSPGDRALLLYPSGLDYVFAFFACLYAGVIAVPAYPPRRNRPTERIQSIVKDAGVSLILTNADALPQLQKGAQQIPELTSIHWMASDALSSGNCPFRPTEITGNTLAFLQYTSGSTSEPKGVMVSHNNLLANEKMMQGAFESSESDVFVSWAPLYHDMGLIGNILQSAFLGAHCVFMPPMSFLEKPLRWLQALDRFQGTMAGGPNFAYDLCVEKTTLPQREALDLSGWKFAANGAEPVRAQTLQRFSEAFRVSGLRIETLYPCYGLAETTLFVTGGRRNETARIQSFDRSALEQKVGIATHSHQANQVDLVGSGTSPQQQQIRIVNSDTGCVCAEGSVGEIWVQGPHVAEGYWGNSAASEATFHAFTSDTKEGPFLRTGDLGFLLENELFVTGRAKDLIIVRGRNYYPHDIERLSETSHPGLRASGSVAFSIDSEQGAPQLVVVQEVNRDSLRLNVEEAADQIRSSIAQEMDLLVDQVVLVKPMRVPKTSSGKVQRSKCKAMYVSGTLEVLGTSVLETQTPHNTSSSVLPHLRNLSEIFSRPEAEQVGLLQQALQHRVASLFGRSQDRIDLSKPLLDLGLDSMHTIELADWIETSWQVQIPLSERFLDATIAELSQRIFKKKHSAKADKLSNSTTLRAVPREPTLPLSYPQQRIWFVEYTHPGKAAYHIPMAIRWETLIDMKALQSSINALIGRHEILRANFQLVAGTPRQMIRDTRTLEVQSIDLQEVEASHRESALKQCLQDEIQRPFDLENDLLLRATRLSLGDQDSVLLLNFHHLVADGWSIGVFLEELVALYHATQHGVPVVWPKLPLQYVDFAVCQRHWVQSGCLETELNYWKQQLHQAPPFLNLPTDFDAETAESLCGDRVPFLLPQPLTDSLRDLSQQQGVTLFMTLLATFQALLFHYTDNEDIVVGTDIANRPGNQTKRIMGVFVNQLVLRTSLTNNPTFVELLRRVKQVALDAYTHQNVPFDLLVETLQPKRKPNRNPLFQVMFVMENHPLPEGHQKGEKLSLLETESGGSPFDVSCVLVEENHRLRGELKYNKSLFRIERIQQMAQHYQSLLKAAVVNPNQSLLQLCETLTDSETNQRQNRLDALKQLKASKMKTLRQRRREGSRRAVILNEENISKIASKVDVQSLVSTEWLPDGQPLPRVFRANVAGVDAMRWAQSNRQWIETELYQTGAVLFRGFPITDADRFQGLIQSLGGTPMEYQERSSPRHSVQGNIYTSTDHPSNESIFVHNEQSYNLRFPSRIWFFCKTPALEGGFTPLADTRKVLQRLTPDIRDEFRKRHYQYVRNFGTGIGLHWKETFQTEDKSIVDAYCQQNGIETRWQGDLLQVRQVRQAIAQHPQTKEQVWFNHATFFHFSTLPFRTQQQLRKVFSESELPNNTYYGDRTPFAPEVLRTLRAAYEAEAYRFHWKAGDVLLVDNMLVAHGRTPFSGPREVFAAMTDPCSWDSVSVEQTGK